MGAENIYPQQPTAEEEVAARAKIEGQTVTTKQPRMAIEKENGYDVLVIYDENGNRTIADVVGKPSENGITPYQQASLDFQKQQVQNQESRWMAEKQANIEAAKFANMGAMINNSNQPAPVDMAAAYEKMRAQIASSLDPGARNWIAQWQKPNPYTKNETAATQFTEERLRLQDEYKQAKSAAKFIRDRMNDQNDPLSQVDITQDTSPEAQMANVILNREKYVTRLLTEAGAIEAISKGVPNPYGAEPSGYFGTTGDITGELAAAKPHAGAGGIMELGSPEAPKAPVYTTPEIPTWLQNVSGLMGRVPTNRVPIQRPSGQMWQSLLPNQQQMYAGLTDWAGKDTFEDTLAQMQKELPQNPSLGSRWKPSFQRA